MEQTAAARSTACFHPIPLAATNSLSLWICPFCTSHRIGLYNGHIASWFQLSGFVCGVTQPVLSCYGVIMNGETTFCLSVDAHWSCSTFGSYKGCCYSHLPTSLSMNMTFHSSGVVPVVNNFLRKALKSCKAGWTCSCVHPQARLGVE